MSATIVNRFVLQLLEQAGKGGVTGALLALGQQNGGKVGDINALSFHWLPVLGYSVGGFIVSLLLGLASVPVGQPGSPTVVKALPADPAAQNTQDLGDITR